MINVVVVLVGDGDTRVVFFHGRHEVLIKYVYIVHIFHVYIVCEKYLNLINITRYKTMVYFEFSICHVRYCINFIVIIHFGSILMLTMAI